MQKKIVKLKFDSSNVFEDYSIDHVLLKVLKNRGVCSKEDYSYKLANLLPPSGLKNIDSACDILYQALKEDSNILIIGDYDTDGATATAVAIRALKKLGFKNINYKIPNRFTDGYGLSPEIVKKCLDLEVRPDLIITVDNGITSVEGVDFAKKNGVKVVITDHHLPGSNLPKADAIVNPQLCTDTFLSQSLAGVGVIFYVMLEFRKFLKGINYFQECNISYPNFADILDLVALGTIADVVPLDKNNRTLIYFGLQRMRRRKANPGIEALLSLSNITERETLSTTDIGFKVAPKLNAAGRMDDMSIGVECLIADNVSKAYELASKLSEFNKERQTIQNDMFLSALKSLPVNPSNMEKKGICLFNEKWHQGISGIMASRVKEIYYQPTIIFAKDDLSNTYKASARSIPGINLRNILASIAEKNKGVLSKFGGHKMAAGLSLEPKNYDIFKEAFHKEIKNCEIDIFSQKIITDGSLQVEDINVHTAMSLREYGLWGEGFPEPVFNNVFRLVAKKVLKDSHMKLRLQFQNCKRLFDAIWFFFPKEIENNLRIDSRIMFFYQLNVSSYLGEKSLSIHVLDIICDYNDTYLFNEYVKHKKSEQTLASS